MPRKNPSAPVPLTPKAKKTLAQSAGQPNARKLISEMAKATLTPAICNRKVTEAHLELILVRVASGDLIVAVCEELGIASGSVYQRAIDDDVFRARLTRAQEMGASTLFERMFQVAWNENEPVERSKLKVAVLDRYARTMNRNLSDRQQIDIRQAVAYILPPDADQF
jgi:hypothetical protein